MSPPGALRFASLHPRPARYRPAPRRPAPRPGHSAFPRPQLAVGRPQWQRRATPPWSWGSPAAGRSSPGRAKVGRRPGIAGGGWGGAPALIRSRRRHRAQHGPGAARGGGAGGGREPDPGRPGQPGPRGRRRLVPAQPAAGGAGGGSGRAAPGAGADQGPPANPRRARGLRGPPSGRQNGDIPGLGRRKKWLSCMPGPEALRRREEMDFREAVPGSWS